MSEETAFKQRLIGDLVAVEMEEEPRGRIKLPDWQRLLRGTVVGIGPGAPLPSGGFAEMQCKVGDRVMFGAAAGMEFVYRGKLCRIMRDDNVDAVLGADVV